MLEDRSHQDLLRDVLQEEALGQLRQTLLTQTLRLARRRRLWRQTRQTASVLVLGAILFGAASYWLRPKEATFSAPRSVAQAGSGYVSVETTPFAAAAIVSTRSLIVADIPADAEPVIVVSTGPGHYQQVNDEQLLAMIGSPAILVRVGPDSEELIFAETKARPNGDPN